MENKTVQKNIKKLNGLVVSDKMDKTAIVEVTRYVKHPRYGKFVKVKRRYKAHNEENKYKVGDQVLIEESRPLSKEKHFKIVN